MLQINYDVLLNDDDYRKNGFKDYIMHRSTIMNEISEKTKTLRTNIAEMTRQIKDKNLCVELMK